MSNILEFCCKYKSGHVDLDKCWGYYVRYSYYQNPESIVVNIGGSEVNLDYDINLLKKLKGLFEEKL